MTSLAAQSDFVGVSRRLLDVLGAEGIGDEWDQIDATVGGVEPRWALLPETVEQCSRALRVASEEGLRVVPAGFGFRLGRGNAPQRVDAVLSLRRMDRIVDHPRDDMTVTVEAGRSIASLDEALRREGQWLPVDPPFPDRTSVGGCLAAQVAGPSRLRFGTIREMVIGLRAVLPDGTVVKSGGRVVKNVAGYDVHRVLTGSFGTLAVIVEATFRLRPVDPATDVVTVRATSLRKLLGLAAALARSSLEARFLEVFVGPDGEPVLEVGLAGIEAELESGRRRLSEIGGGPWGVEVAGRTTVGEVLRRIETIAGPGEDVLVLRVGVRTRSLRGRFDEMLRRLGQPTAEVRAHVHAGSGVARFRLGRPDAGRVADVVAELRREVVPEGGYVVVESAPVSFAGTIDPWGFDPAGLALAKGVKRAFDPEGLLSPGRFVGGI